MSNHRSSLPGKPIGSTRKPQSKHSARPAYPTHSVLPVQGLRKPVTITRVVLVTVVAIMLIALIVTASDHIRFDNAANSSSRTSSYVSPYTWNNLNRTDQLYRYTSGGIVQSKAGIDVSDHQGDIDWRAVATDGIQFAYIRLGYRGTTEGGIFVDDCFQQNLQEAKASDIQTGVYFYSQATTEAEAVEEADFVLQHLAGTKLDYPVAFDAEPTTGTSRISNLSNDQLTKNAVAFCTEIEKGGYSAIIYGNNEDMANFDHTQLTSWPIWYAEYGSLPVAQFDFTMWQYSNAGSINGIATSVDLDIDLTTAYDAARSQ